MEKQIKLTVEQAKELYKLNPEYRSNILSDFTDVELGIVGKKWDDVNEEDKWLWSISNINYEVDPYPISDSSFFAQSSEEGAMAVGEKYKLMIEMQKFADFYNDWWKADYKNADEKKYGIELLHGSACLTVAYGRNAHVFGISVKTRVIAELMLETFKERIQKFYVL